jgi:predicted MFS family arabinose efflux permease
MSFQIIGIVFISRLILDTGTRLVYPFIPQFSTGLGLTVVGFSWLIFLRAMAGMAGPLFGLLADQYGRRKIMVAGLLCQAVAVVGVALSWQWWATAPMLLFGLSVAAFLPAQQAYISDQASDNKRGRALGAIEFSWALTGVITLPVIGWLIDSFGWRTPLFFLSILSLVGAGLVWLRLPAVEHTSQGSLSGTKMWSLLTRPNVMASVAVGMFFFVAVGTFITLWGIWLSADFGLTAIALGLVATMIGLAELTGSALSTLFIDRIGKRRGSIIGLLLLGITLLVLPFTQFSLLTAIIVLFLMGVFVEFALVSLLPLYAEQAPEARATVFSLVGFGMSVGVASGSPLTATLWEQYGLWAVSIVSAASVLAAVGLIALFLDDDSSTSIATEEVQAQDLVS